MPARLFDIGLDRLAPLVEYQTRPVEFLVEKLGIPERTIRWGSNPGYAAHKWDGTEEPLVSALDGLAKWENVGVRAATGTQKTYVLGAGGMLWFLGTFENAIVVTLSPKQEQLKLHLWKEVRELWPKFTLLFPSATLLDLKLRMRGGLDEKWTATGFIAGVGANEESANRARGFHAEHALYIFEEAPGVDDAIHTAIDFTCTAPHNLRLKYGNPDNEQDALSRFCRKPSVRSIRISALDHPNVVTGDASIVPGAASRVSVAAHREEYGEDDPLYKAFVRGIAPAQAADSLIRLEWLEAAAARYDDERYRVGIPSIGVDVADSPSGDKISIARGLGACLLEIESRKVGPWCPSALDLGDLLALEIAAEGINPENVGVDPVGVGSATVNRLRQLGIIVPDLNGGLGQQPRVDEDAVRENREAKPGDPKKVPAVPIELFGNLRAQMYWQFRKDVQRGRIALVKHKRAFEDLIAVKWFKKGGKIWVQPKEEVVEVLRRSPDEGDSVVYWNWSRARLPKPVEAPPPSAFDPAVLAAEAKESRRIRTKPVVPRSVDPVWVESID